MDINKFIYIYIYWSNGSLLMVHKVTIRIECRRTEMNNSYCVSVGVTVESLIA